MFRTLSRAIPRIRVFLPPTSPPFLKKQPSLPFRHITVPVLHPNHTQRSNIQTPVQTSTQGILKRNTNTISPRHMSWHRLHSPPLITSHLFLPKGPHSRQFQTLLIPLRLNRELPYLNISLLFSLLSNPRTRIRSPSCWNSRLIQLAFECTDCADGRVGNASRRLLNINTLVETFSAGKGFGGVGYGVEGAGAGVLI